MTPQHIKDKVREMKANGCSYKEIGEATGLHNSRIGYLLHGHKPRYLEDLKEMKAKKKAVGRPDKTCTCCGTRKVADGNYFLCGTCERNADTEEQPSRVLM